MFDNNGIIPNLGLFQVRIGPMGSGKTSRVIAFTINNEKRFVDIANKNYIRILLVRPSKDSRMGDENIFKPHGDHFNYDVRKHNNVDVVVLQYGRESDLLLKYGYYDLYIFDEGQFFHPEIAPLLAKLSFLEKEIYFTALLHDFQDKVFPTTLAVLSLPEVSNIKKLYNQCAFCGKKGFHSARMQNGKIINSGPQVLIGDMNNSTDEYTYIGICTYCKKKAIGEI